MNRNHLRKRILHQVALLRAMADRLSDIAEYLEKTAKTLSQKPMRISRSEVDNESDSVAALDPAAIATSLAAIAKDMTPNMDQITNSKYNRNYD
ncbi:hypothetical protein [Aquamicrobium terrae]|uniref:Uncharacterized protein n=1 Tax=Aquamicrobium terrae TaxID=1324945 RepID=A0ABV2MV33_9HYPH